MGTYTQRPPKGPEGTMMYVNLRRTSLYRRAPRRKLIRWVRGTLYLLDLEAWGVILMVVFLGLIALGAIALLSAPLWLS